MDWKKIGKAILFPHFALLIVLLPIAAAFCGYSLAFLDSTSPIACVSYAIAAYTLTVWCARIPQLVKRIKKVKEENKYAKRWFDDAGLRVKTSLYGTLIWNLAYAVFQLWLGAYHLSFWYVSLALYYFSVAVMRFFLVKYARKHTAGAEMVAELKRYRACGWVFLVMNLALTAIIFFMVYFGRSFEHHQITTIAMAAYTFTTLTVAIINVVKFRKYNSPVYSASKAISLACACVSMLTLESSMLTAFGDGTIDTKMMLGISGGAISLFILVMAIYMIVRSTKQIRKIKTEKTEKDGELYGE